MDWTSSDDLVATVNSTLNKAQITAISKGNSTIIGTNSNGKVVIKCLLTAEDDVKSNEMKYVSGKVQPGGTYQKTIGRRSLFMGFRRYSFNWIKVL